MKKETQQKEIKLCDCDNSEFRMIWKFFEKETVFIQCIKCKNVYTLSKALYMEMQLLINERKKKWGDWNEGMDRQK